SDVNGGQVLAGDVLEYGIRITNTGTADTDNATMTDPIPPLTTLVAGSVRENGVPEPDGALAAGLVLTSPGAPPGVIRIGDAGAVTVVFRVRIDPAAPTGAIIGNQAFAGAQNAATVPSDDPRTPEPNDPTVVVVGGGAGLIAQKTYDPTPVGDNGNGFFDVGEDIQYRIRITNVGQSPAADVRLDDPLPTANATYTAGTLSLNGTALTDAVDGDAGEVVAGVVHVRVGTLAAGETALVALRVHITAGPQVVNQGTVGSRDTATSPTDADGNPANGYQPTITPVGMSSAPRIIKTAFDVNGGLLQPGDIARYSLPLPNNVTSGGLRFHVSDDIPAGTNYVAASAVGPPGVAPRFTAPPAGMGMRGTLVFPAVPVDAGAD